jgi:hypothetical protein
MMRLKRVDLAVEMGSVHDITGVHYTNGALKFSRAYGEPLRLLVSPAYNSDYSGDVEIRFEPVGVESSDFGETIPVVAMRDVVEIQISDRMTAGEYSYSKMSIIDNLGVTFQFLVFWASA